MRRCLAAPTPGAQALRKDVLLRELLCKGICALVMVDNTKAFSVTSVRESQLVVSLGLTRSISRDPGAV